MTPRKLIRMAAAARVLGGFLSQITSQRSTGIPASRQRGLAFALRNGRGLPWVLAAGAALAVGLVAFMILSVVLSALVVLVGVLLKVALAAAIGLVMFRWLRPARRGLQIVVVPPSEGRRRRG